MADEDDSDEDVVVHHQPETRVYLNQMSAVVIRQRGNDVADEDPFVFFRPETIPDLVLALIRAAEKAGFAAVENDVLRLLGHG